MMPPEVREMPRVMVNMKLTEDERKLLAKAAKANDLTEADYLRVCMIMDRLMEADPLAMKITAGRLREKVGRRVADVLRIMDEPVKAA
jgi:uncharacterized protein (DUF1778 family)